MCVSKLVRRLSGWLLGGAGAGCSSAEEGSRRDPADLRAAGPCPRVVHPPPVVEWSRSMLTRRPRWQMGCTDRSEVDEALQVWEAHADHADGRVMLAHHSVHLWAAELAEAGREAATLVAAADPDAALTMGELQAALERSDIKYAATLPEYSMAREALEGRLQVAPPRFYCRNLCGDHPLSSCHECELIPIF